MDNKYERVEQRYNQAAQHEGSLKAEGKVEYPPAQPPGPAPEPGKEPRIDPLDPADEPITLGDSPPVQLEDLRTSQDGREV